MGGRRLAALLIVVGIVLLLIGATRDTSAPEAQPAPVTHEQVTTAALRIAEGFRRGDTEGLLRTLHPSVRETYGARQCRTFFERATDPDYGFDVVDVRGPGRWVWAADGKAFDVEWAYEVDVRRTSSRGTSGGTAHLSLLGDELVWFSDCGDPVGGRG